MKTITTKEFRARFNLSQSELAGLLPVNVRTLQDWEVGRGNPPLYLTRALNDLARELKTKKGKGSK